MSAFAELAAAYEGLESDASFPDEVALERYRASMLERSAPQTAFLGERLDGPADVVEVGSGNGRLLIDLGLAGLLGRGLGVELSESRTRFAQRWTADAGLADRLDLRAGDALAEDLGEAAFDVAACITGAFAYFDAFTPGSAGRLLAALHAALRPGGLLLLELYPHPAERRLIEAAGGGLRTWRELDGDDPWRFYLSDMALAGDVLTHRKTFVHRTSGEIDEGRSERLVLYTEDSLRGALAAAGFGEVTSFAGWTAEPYAGGDLLVVTARR